MYLYILVLLSHRLAILNTLKCLRLKSALLLIPQIINCISIDIILLSP